MSVYQLSALTRHSDTLALPTRYAAVSEVTIAFQLLFEIAPYLRILEIDQLTGRRYDRFRVKAGSR